MITAANVITGLRIALSIALLFFPALSPAFYALYLAAGLTDMIDGPVARKTNTASESGARLDTAADLVFVAACLFKLLPILNVPVWLYGWIGIIALVKGVNIVSGYAVRKRFVAVHSVANRVTGLMLFLLPLTFHLLDLRCSATAVCAAATFAAVQEGHLIRTGKAGSQTEETHETCFYSRRRRGREDDRRTGAHEDHGSEALP